MSQGTSDCNQNLLIYENTMLLSVGVLGFVFHYEFNIVDDFLDFLFS